MTEKDAQLRLVKIMSKLKPRGERGSEYIYIPSDKGIEDDLDFLDLMVSHVMLDMEAKVREERAKHGQ